MPRALWKGAISFGLINIPVELYAAEKHDDLDFTMLDKRDLSPVGYKRYNKKTGKEVVWDNIIKGYEYEDGQYVLLSDEDLRRANVEATQSIDIECFIDADEVPITYYEQPYYLAPLKAGTKAYALLRETLRKTGKMAIARIVIRTRQHIAAVMPFDDILNLITLRFPAELKAPSDLEIPASSAKQAGVSAREVEMAQSLVDSMTAKWDPDTFHDTYRDDILAMVQKKIKSKQTHTVAESDDSAPDAGRSTAQVIDLMALLKQSIAGKQSGKAAGKERDNQSGEPTETAAKAVKSAKPVDNSKASSGGKDKASAPASIASARSAKKAAAKAPPDPAPSDKATTRAAPKKKVAAARTKTPVPKKVANSR